jgi:hypothetical protein
MIIPKVSGFQGEEFAAPGHLANSKHVIYTLQLRSETR